MFQPISLGKDLKKLSRALRLSVTRNFVFFVSSYIIRCLCALCALSTKAAQKLPLMHVPMTVPIHMHVDQRGLDLCPSLPV